MRVFRCVDLILCVFLGLVGLLFGVGKGAARAA